MGLYEYYWSISTIRFMCLRNMFTSKYLPSLCIQHYWYISSLRNNSHYHPSAKFAEDVGCPVDEYGITATLECLRGKEAADLAAKQYNVKDYIINYYHFVPTVDGKFLTAPPASMIKFSPIDSSIPVLIGSNANEGFLSLMYYLTNLMPDKEFTSKQRNLTTHEYQRLVEVVFNFYPKKVRKL